MLLLVLPSCGDGFDDEIFWWEGSNADEGRTSSGVMSVDDHGVEPKNRRTSQKVSINGPQSVSGCQNGSGGDDVTRDEIWRLMLHI